MRSKAFDQEPEAEGSDGGSLQLVDDQPNLRIKAPEKHGLLSESHLLVQ